MHDIVRPKDGWSVFQVLSAGQVLAGGAYAPGRQHRKDAFQIARRRSPACREEPRLLSIEPGALLPLEAGTGGLLRRQLPCSGSGSQKSLAGTAGFVRPWFKGRRYLAKRFQAL